MKNILTIILIWCTSVCSAQIKYGETVADSKKSFQAGEEITLVANYKIGILNTDVATVKFTVANATRDGKKAYHIHAVGEMDPSYSWFFQMRDVYQTWIDYDNLRPIYFENNIREGSYRFHSNYKYDWANARVNTTYRKERWDSDRKKTMPLTRGSYDALALFYNLRCVEAADFQVNQRYVLSLVLEDTIRRVSYRFLGREEKNIRGTGKFKTLKFACQIATSSGESFKDGSEFYVWFSDDENKIPLYADVPIRVGTVRVRMTKYKNLKHPLSSKLK